MGKKILFFSVLWALNFYVALAQNINLSGKVLDVNNEAIIGAVVTHKETNKVTTTDLDGNFELQNVALNSSLTISYIGYETQNVKITKNFLEVVLASKDSELDEVIVVAYGTTSKAGYTGSASSVNKDKITQSQVSSVSRLLQGAASGVQSISSSGQPGSDASIYIRGVGSINASSTPLYIVDGVPYEGDLNSINPADIESINVLKDAASTSIYGSRAGNGLIVITTKQGNKNKKAVIEASFKYGVSSRAVEDYKKVGTNDYFRLYWEAMRNQELYVNGRTPEAAANYASNNIVSVLGINPYGSAYPNPVGIDGDIVAGARPLWDDDWTDAYTQDANRTEAQVSVSGGGENSNYYISLGYLDDQGIAIASDFKRYSGRLNFNADIRPWLRVSTGLSLSHSKQNAPQSQDSNLANSLNFARMIPNFYPIWEREEDGSFKTDPVSGGRIIDYGPYRPSAASPRYNHLGSSEFDFSRVVRDVASIRLSAEFDLLKNLTYKASANIDYTNKNDHYYVNPTYGAGSYNDNPGSVSKYNYRTVNFTGNNLLTYNTTINEYHSLKLLLGQEYNEYNTNNIYGSREGFPLLGYYEPVAASALSDFNGSADQYKLLSFFGNAEYNYKHKYYGSASIRRDGSSRFSPDARWGTFWSVGASWRINEEDFLSDVREITKLTLRGSYGGQGNDNIGSYYAYQALFDIKNNLGESGFVTSTLATPKLKWETNLSLNIGLDFGFFDNRVSGSFEFFNRQSKDLLFTMPKPLSTGYSGYLANIGALRNRGIEFSLSFTPVKTKDWLWTVGINGTHYKNVITELPQNEIISGDKLLKVGNSIYDFYLVEWGGINPESGLPQWYKNDENGNRVLTEVYKETNKEAGKPDHRINAGSALPDFSGGFNTSLQYKDFDLSLLFAYSIGGKIYNGDKTSLLHNGSSAGRAMSVDMLKRWTPENTSANIPRMQTVNANAWTNSSTRFLIDADYLRLKNITVGYNLPANICNKLFLSKLKVYAQAENLWTLFKEDGIDPEQTIGGSTYYRYPAMKTISFGLNVSF